MFKTTSPYLKLLFENEIEWKEFSKESIRQAKEINKPLFIHIGYIGKICERESALKLFSDKEISGLINYYFYPIAIDAEHYPEMVILAENLLNINHITKKIPANIIFLPDFRPVSAFSELDKDEFMTFISNFLDAFECNRDTLETLALTTASMIEDMGSIEKMDKPAISLDKLLKKTVSYWISRLYSPDEYYNGHPFNMPPTTVRFLLHYEDYFSDEKVEKFTRSLYDRVINSATVDPIDGGCFSETKDIYCNMPLYEKSVCNNIQIGMLYIDIFKKKGLERFKILAEKTADFLDREMRSPDGGYFTYFTLSTSYEESAYYQYSVRDIKTLFPHSYERIITALNMNIFLPPDKRQVVQNSYFSEQLTLDELRLLRERRRNNPGVLKDERELAYINASAIKLYTDLYTITDKKEYLQRALDLYDFINTRFMKGSKIYRMRTDVVDSVEGGLYEYVIMSAANLTLYRVLKESKYLDTSISITDYIIANFLKESNGMFHSESKDNNLVPYKREYNIDGFLPSSNSLMCFNLILLNKYTGDERYLNMAKQQLYNISPHIMDSAPLLGHWCHNMLILIELEESYRHMREI